jgi:hypothetical protein
MVIIIITVPAHSGMFPSYLFIATGELRDMFGIVIIAQSFPTIRCGGHFVCV